jgi:hypothetical protein
MNMTKLHLMLATTPCRKSRFIIKQILMSERKIGFRWHSFCMDCEGDKGHASGRSRLGANDIGSIASESEEEASLHDP